MQECGEGPSLLLRAAHLEAKTPTVGVDTTKRHLQLCHKSDQFHEYTNSTMFFSQSRGSSANGPILFSFTEVSF